MLELLVSMVILTVGIVGVLHVFSSSMLTVKASETQSVAAVLAHQVASELERRSNNDEGQISGNFGDTAPGYAWTADLKQAKTKELIRAEIVVEWGSGPSTHQYNLVTYLYKPSSMQGDSVSSPAERQRSPS